MILLLHVVIETSYIGGLSQLILNQIGSCSVLHVTMSAKCRYITELASAHKGRPSHFQYLSSHGNKYTSPTNFSFYADDLNMHFCLFPAGQYSLPFSSVSPLSYVSEVNVPPLTLTAVTEDVL